MHHNGKQTQNFATSQAHQQHLQHAPPRISPDHPAPPPNDQNHSSMKYTLLFLAFVSLTHAQVKTQNEPTNAAEAAAKKAAEDKAVDEKYQALKATLPPDQQAWKPCSNRISATASTSLCTKRTKSLVAPMPGTSCRTTPSSPEFSSSAIPSPVATLRTFARPWLVKPTCIVPPKTEAPPPMA